MLSSALRAVLLHHHAAVAIPFNSIDVSSPRGIEMNILVAWPQMAAWLSATIGGLRVTTPVGQKNVIISTCTLTMRLRFGISWMRAIGVSNRFALLRCNDATFG